MCKSAPKRTRRTWRDYEQLKAEWSARNRAATPHQYAAAMRRIAKECGL